jgi:hypothetical protein
MIFDVAKDFFEWKKFFFEMMITSLNLPSFSTNIFRNSTVIHCYPFRYVIFNSRSTVFSRLKNEEEEVEKFVMANTQELAKDKWLCPLSGTLCEVCDGQHAGAGQGQVALPSLRYLTVLVQTESLAS